VSIDRGERLFLGSDPINIHELGPKLKEKLGDAGSQSVFLRADQNVTYGAVAMVVDTLRQAGIEQISMVTEPMPRR
jgi:biopolymer transport protein ExbD/biopolymer transport protein TolR